MTKQSRTSRSRDTPSSTYNQEFAFGGTSLIRALSTQFILCVFYFMPSRTILTHLVEWNPEWIRIVEFTSRLIQWISFPRSLFKEATERDELSNSWVYFLFWEDENEKVQVYIGQALDLSERLKYHLRSSEKDFWTATVCFTKWREKFDSAEVNFLESKLIKKAGESRRVDILNWTLWNKEHLSEFKISDLEEFLNDLEILLWTLGYSILSPYIQKNTKWEIFDPSNKKEIIYSIKRWWYESKMVYTNEWIIVIEWSTWKQITEWWIKDGILKRREKLELQKIIKIQDDGSIIFLKDHLFKTPSWAAMIVAWNTLNGWWEWKDELWKCLWENENYWQ